MTRSILIVDSDPDTSGVIASSAIVLGHTPHIVNERNKALTIAQMVKPTIVFLKNDQHSNDIVEVLKQLSDYSRELPVYLMTELQENAMGRLRAARRNGFYFELASLPLSHEQVVAIIEANVPLDSTSTTATHPATYSRTGP